MEPEDRLPARVGGVDERITNPPDIDHAVVGELRFRLDGAAAPDAPAPLLLPQRSSAAGARSGARRAAADRPRQQ